MTATLKGASASQVIPNNTTIRLTFGETYGIINDDEFAPHMGDVWNRLLVDARVAPLSRSSAYPGAVTSTVDVKEHENYRTFGEIVAAVERLGNRFVELKSAEVLTPAKAKEATTPAGAQARDDTAATQAEKDKATDPVSKFFAGLSDVAKKAFIVVVIVACLVALVYAGKIRKELF